jgi:hypothetical protein
VLVDVRNWDFLDKRLAEMGSLGSDLKSSGFAEKIAFTAFFWTLIQYHEAEDEIGFRTGAISLPDYLTPFNREKVETVSRILDAWMSEQDASAHPRYADLRRVVDIGLQATTHPLFGPRKFRE